MPPAGVGSWDQLLATTQSTPHETRRSRHPCRARMDRHASPSAITLLAERAIRAADPEALFFGDRLPIYYDPAAVRAMAPHVDAIAMNYNVDSSDGWIADYFFDGLRKIVGRQARARLRMVFRGAREPHRQPQQRPSDDGRHPRRAGGRRRRRDRAILPRSRKSSAPTGSMYYDHPEGRAADGEDYDFGLVDINDRPYERLTAALAMANRRALRDPCRAPRCRRPTQQGVRPAPRRDLGE